MAWLIYWSVDLSINCWLVDWLIDWLIDDRDKENKIKRNSELRKTLELTTVHDRMMSLLLHVCIELARKGRNADDSLLAQDNGTDIESAGHSDNITASVVHSL